MLSHRKDLRALLCRCSKEWVRGRRHLFIIFNRTENNTKNKGESALSVYILLWYGEIYFIDVTFADVFFVWCWIEWLMLLFIIINVCLWISNWKIVNSNFAKKPTNKLQQKSVVSVYLNKMHQELLISFCGIYGQWTILCARKCK